MTNDSDVHVVRNRYGEDVMMKNGREVIWIKTNPITGEVGGELFVGTSYQDSMNGDVKREYAQRSERYSEYGSFTKLLYEPGKPLDIGLSGANVARALYLSTYIDYDGVLFRECKSGISAITKNECRQILGLNDDTFLDFWNSAINGRVITVHDRKIILNRNCFIRGKTPHDKAFVRIGHEGMRGLYESCNDPRKHKLISYVFDLIPIMNRSYGVLCENPDEKFRSHVRPATVGTLSAVMGYDKSNIRRIMKSLTDLRLQFRSQKDVPALYEIPKGIYGTKKAYIINPRICCAASSHMAIENEIATYSDSRDMGDAV